jgi:hypothetical protein
MKFQTPYIFLILFSCFFSLAAQTDKNDMHWKVDSLIVITAPTEKIEFPNHHFPLWETLQITKNSQNLQQELDFKVMNNEYLYFFNSLKNKDTLRLIYKRLPFGFNKTHTYFSETAVEHFPDSLKRMDSLLVKRKLTAFENPLEHIPATLQTRGSIMRGVEIASNRDLTLNSGLNLEMSGKLTEHIEIVAALTDEATPVQPEGNTKTLKEIDKVFVKFNTPYVDGVVGDFNLNYEERAFAKIRRKLQGLSLSGTYEKQNAKVTIAGSRGFFNHLSIIGKEGTQGPYQLTGANGELDIIVLAGTEYVWLNGKKLTRGASNDYIIEYGNGQITFTHNQLITSESRIEVDYEYYPANQKYSRNVYGLSTSNRLWDGKLKLNTIYYQEADDPTQLLEQDENLSETEKNIIKAAGDNPLKAVTDNQSYVGDSLGSYLKKDTVITEKAYEIYQYAGKNKGDYIVRFSFVGKQKGDYQRDRIGTYRFVGINKGDYMPIKLLPLPAKHQMMDIDIAWNPSKNIEIKSEYAFSTLDKNTISQLDDQNNQGNALKLSAKINAQELKLGGYQLGNIGFKVDGKYVEKNFNSTDRIVLPDDLRNWNMANEDLNDRYEKSYNAYLTYLPYPSFNFNFEIGNLKKQILNSNRMKTGIHFNHLNWFSSRIDYEDINSNRLDNISRWRRFNADMERAVYLFKPRFFYKAEERRVDNKISLNGFRFDEYGVKVALLNWKYLAGDVRYQSRKDFVFDANRELSPQALSRTGELKLELKNVSDSQLSLHFIQREKDYDSKFENIKIDSLKQIYVDILQQDTSFQDRSTTLAEINASHSRWKNALNLSLKYRISTENTALKEKIYLDVGEGNGNYRYDEPLSQYVPDADGNFVLYILPSGQFEPVTNLQSSFRVKWDPYVYWKRQKTGAANWLKHIGTETHLHIEEETKEDDIRSVYLLNVSKFQGRKTLRGVIRLKEDLYIAKRNRALSFRVRYRYQRSLLNQYLDAIDNQTAKTKEIGLQIRWRPALSWRSETELKWKNHFRENKASISRNRDIVGYYAQERLSYRLKNGWESSIETDYALEENDIAAYPIRLWYLTGKFKLGYSLPGKGRISSEYQYQTVHTLKNPLQLTVPYEMANGKREGVSQNWQIRAEYTLMKNIVFSVFYSGRDDADFSRIIHNGQAEIRAFF